MKKHSVSLNARTRTLVKKKTTCLREEKKIPAILYGKGIDNQMLEIDDVPFGKTFAVTGETTLVDLSIDGQPSTKVLIYDVQREPIHNSVLHVDFYSVKLDEKLTLKIPLVFTGESKAVKELGGVFVHPMAEIEVRCLPDNLVHELTVDIGSLMTFNDTITCGDIVLPSGIELIGHADEIVALVASPSSEEELKLEGKPLEDVSSVEVEKKGKKEEEHTEKK